ncbi:MAG: hypothetical protein ACFBSD_13445 [Paracoccaceae bacterium]
MDTTLPPDMTAAIEASRRSRARRRSRYSVTGDGVHCAVLELTHSGFVIEADRPPPFGGYVDILDGERRIDRRLVVCVWAADGLVAYEFKRDGAGWDVGPDYVPPARTALLDPPGD